MVLQSEASKCFSNTDCLGKKLQGFALQSLRACISVQFGDSKNVSLLEEVDEMNDATMYRVI